MAFCKNCGREIEGNATFCDGCGATQDVVPTVEQTQQYQQAQSQEADKGGFLWGLLGCCIPVVGLILFLIWKDTKPKTSKAAGIGALVSVIASVVIYIIYFVIIVGVVGATAGMSGL